MTSWSIHSSCLQPDSLLFSQCYLCCGLQLAKYLCVCYYTLQSQAAVEYSIDKCCLWLCVVTLFPSGLLHPLLPNRKSLLSNGWHPCSYISNPCSSLVTKPLHTTELLCKTGWAKPMDSYRCRISVSAHRKISLSIQNQNRRGPQIEIAERVNTDSITLPPSQEIHVLRFSKHLLFLFPLPASTPRPHTPIHSCLENSS